MVDHIRDYAMSWAKSARARGALDFEEPMIVYDGSLLIECRLGAYAMVSRDCEIAFATTGRYSSIGPRCLIGPSNHPTRRLTTSIVSFSPQFDFFKKGGDALRPYEGAHRRTTIGHDVWLGANVTVMDGVTIGDGAIVAAGAVVTRDVAPMTVVGGIPARKIRDRFDAETARRLLGLRWWRYDLIDWQATGLLPPMGDLTGETLDAMEGSVRDGTAPPIRDRRCRIQFKAAGAVQEGMPDEEGI